jgi:hypothetical protein
MKVKYFFMTALVILMLAVLFTHKTKEGFQQQYCQRFKNCMDCSSASGCSWCGKGNICLTSTTLKSTDKECNQMNTISSSFLCPGAGGIETPTLPEAIASNDVMYDFSLYKNRITDKIPPPNLYMAGEMKVSNEDLLSNMNDVRNDITNYRVEMPGIIASTVEEQIKPMVKGILAENYYIQGFEDMNAKTKCTTYNSCSGCVGDNACAWNPRSNQCEPRGPNNLWQIISPSKCVLSSTTINTMMARPGGNV